MKLVLVWINGLKKCNSPSAEDATANNGSYPVDVGVNGPGEDEETDGDERRARDGYR